jgi:plastocyanin
LSKLRLFLAAIVAASLAVGATAALAGTKTVKIGDDWFVSSTKSNPSVTISKGSKVKFKWTGEDTHNVTLKSAPSGVTKSKFKIDDRSSGSKSTPTFTRAGTYKFVCTIHEAEGQKVTVKVKKPS